MAWVYAYYVLAVGQGTGTLVQVCKDTLDEPVWSAIIDLGSEGWKKDVGVPSAKFAAEKLKNAEDEENVVLDAVILSHSDSDHINLLPDLLEEFTKPDEEAEEDKPNLTVESVWYGGEKSRYKKGSKPNLLDVLDEYAPDSGSILHKPANNQSSFDEDPPTRLADSGKDAWVWLLIGNTIAEDVTYDSNAPTRSASDGYDVNTKSLVVGVTFGKDADRKRIIATGDATGLTIAKCREVMKDNELDLSGTLSLTLPHHGSATTTYDLLGLKAESGSSEELARKNIERFSKALGAVTVSASAGERSTFRHPAIGVIKDFGAFVGEGKYEDAALKGNEHFYTFYTPSGYFKYAKVAKGKPSDWPSKAGWYSARTKKNAFTTDYFVDKKEPVPKAWPQSATYLTQAEFDPEPLDTISWAFIVKESGKSWEVKNAVDTLRLSEGQARRLEAALGGPLPEARFILVPSADAEG
jgi:beta-lactamase superfamily II metal-dependent hydrolase